MTYVVFLDTDSLPLHFELLSLYTLCKVMRSQLQALIKHPLLQPVLQAFRAGCIATQK